ncbi:ribosomal protein S18 [Aspergillus ellipticus CBS 707.79]|uniref:Small ribosomal subunit protein bS18m n=1 Tax=Aspergillus ellipticus CBS 707.79 TaxID=1448320 RepID=A0A319DRD1_9EURO|nr:ribosomal protein S18 [Aspergillus ellipticus CBS 707.79]
MALHLFSWSPLRTIGSTIGSVSAAACRWNSTAAPMNPPASPPRARHIQGTGPRVFRRRTPNRQKFMEEQRAQSESRALEKYQTREWKAGDVYAPHDLSASEMKKWKKRHSPATDAFDSLNLNPLHQYKNFSIMSEYMTSMGRIKHRNSTGLRPVNQRKMAKAIRRAIGIGIMPSVHRHPEILAAEAKARVEGSGF